MLQASKWEESEHKIAARGSHDRDLIASVVHSAMANQQSSSYFLSCELIKSSTRTMHGLSENRRGKYTEYRFMQGHPRVHTKMQFTLFFVHTVVYCAASSCTDQHRINAMCCTHHTRAAVGVASNCIFTSRNAPRVYVLCRS